MVQMISREMLLVVDSYILSFFFKKKLSFRFLVSKVKDERTPIYEKTHRSSVI